jgi:hypothetical protein
VQKYFPQKEAKKRQKNRVCATYTNSALKFRIFFWKNKNIFFKNLLQFNIK